MTLTACAPSALMASASTTMLSLWRVVEPPDALNGPLQYELQRHGPGATLRPSGARSRGLPRPDGTTRWGQARIGASHQPRLGAYRPGAACGPPGPLTSVEIAFQLAPENLSPFPSGAHLIALTSDTDGRWHWGKLGFHFPDRHPFRVAARGRCEPSPACRRAWPLQPLRCEQIRMIHF